ncbi:MAG: hypothetical protein K2X93_22870 [Candidatus Obscuribacterales bacterium]|nr:hypothetical protein [Candidatus Obscuribacterales bacterium]
MRREVYVVGGIVMGLVVVAIVGGNWLMSSMIDNSFNMRPELVAEAYFETPVSEFRDVKGVGIHWLGYEHTVRFRFDGPIEIKNRNEYESFSPDENDIRMFKADFPEDAAQFAPGEPLECLRVKIPPPTPGSSGRYLVNNTKSHMYFLRSWNAH